VHNGDAELRENRSSGSQEDKGDTYTSTDGDLLNPFSREFEKLRRAIITFVMSVRKGQLDSHWKNFHEILYLSVCPIIFSENSSFKVSLKSNKNNR
jgi:hypothetical protein